MRFGSGDAVFRPLIEEIEVVTIAAAWDPTRRKDVVPSIVEIAIDIGVEMEGPHCGSLIRNFDPVS